MKLEWNAVNRLLRTEQNEQFAKSNIQSYEMWYFPLICRRNIAKIIHCVLGTGTDKPTEPPYFYTKNKNYTWKSVCLKSRTKPLKTWANAGRCLKGVVNNWYNLWNKPQEKLHQSDTPEMGVMDYVIWLCFDVIFLHCLHHSIPFWYVRKGCLCSNK